MANRLMDRPLALDLLHNDNDDVGDDDDNNYDDDEEDGDDDDVDDDDGGDDDDGDDDDGGGASDTGVRRKQLINCSKHIFATWNFRFPTNEETR